MCGFAAFLFHMQAANAPHSEDELSANALPYKKKKQKTQREQADGDVLLSPTLEKPTKGAFATPCDEALHHGMNREVNHCYPAEFHLWGRRGQHPQPIRNDERLSE